MVSFSFYSNIYPIAHNVAQLFVSLFRPRHAQTVTDRTNPSAITWLESTLPRTTSAYNNDAKDLKKLQDEVRTLEDQLQCECVRNTELREQINASRTRSDEMVALMQLLRSETEAVLERFVLFGLFVCMFVVIAFW